MCAYHCVQLSYTTQNSSDNLPSYLLDNHHYSDAVSVYWRGWGRSQGFGVRGLSGDNNGKIHWSLLLISLPKPHYRQNRWHFLWHRLLTLIPRTPFSSNRLVFAIFNQRKLYEHRWWFDADVVWKWCMQKRAKSGMEWNYYYAVDDAR